jgi:saxitoxin biosynthesis operon SxtJ-like protein
MQWSDVVKPPSTRMLRQFAGLCLAIFGGLAMWRAWHGDTGIGTVVLATAAVLIGIGGLAAPAAIRPVYSAWMIAAFPIGWTVSKVVLGAMLYLVFTPVAIWFRITGRDPLRLRRQDHASLWQSKPTPRTADEYLRQY